MPRPNNLATKAMLVAPVAVPIVLYAIAAVGFIVVLILLLARSRKKKKGRG